MKLNELHDFAESYELRNISSFVCILRFFEKNKFVFSFVREQVVQQAQRHRQWMKQRATTSKTRDEFEKQENISSIYRRKTTVDRIYLNSFRICNT